MELLSDDGFILLGPCGGVAKASGKYEKYHCCDRDFDEMELTIHNDIKKAMSGDIDVINLG